MNLLLLEDADFVAADRAVLSGRRIKHLHEVHGAESGDTLRVEAARPDVAPAAQARAS